MLSLIALGLNSPRVDCGSVELARSIKMARSEVTKRSTPRAKL
jgi:hypothetical protein